jgi:hypothetical protein
MLATTSVVCSEHWMRWRPISMRSNDDRIFCFGAPRSQVGSKALSTTSPSQWSDQGLDQNYRDRLRAVFFVWGHPTIAGVWRTLLTTVSRGNESSMLAIFIRYPIKNNQAPDCSEARPIQRAAYIRPCCHRGFISSRPALLSNSENMTAARARSFKGFREDLWAHFGHISHS